MASSKGPRFQLEVQLPSHESKASFSALLDEAKQLITPPGQRKVDNYGLLTRLIGLVKQHYSPSSQTLSEQEQLPPRQLSWQDNSGQCLRSGLWMAVRDETCFMCKSSIWRYLYWRCWSFGSESVPVWTQSLQWLVCWFNRDMLMSGPFVVEAGVFHSGRFSTCMQLHRAGVYFCYRKDM